MDPTARTEAAAIAEALAELAEEIDLAGDDDASPDEVAEVWTLADAVLGRYRTLVDGLDGADKTEVQRSLGLKVAKIEGLLTRIPARAG